MALDKILVVDDDPAIGELLELVLAEEGYAVDRAIGGREALDLAGENRYALIILDVMMPIMDGLTCFRLLRATPKTRDTSIVFMTADRNQPGRNLLGTRDGYLTKPFDLSALVSLVSRLVDHSDVAAAG